MEKNKKISLKNRKKIVSRYGKVHHKEVKSKKEPKFSIKTNNILIISIILGAVFLIVALIFLLPNINSKLNNQPAKTDSSVNELKSDKLFIYVFGDFECPYTKRIADTYEKILNEYKDRVQIFYKHLPLSFHPNAMSAAIASECAKKIDKEKYDQYNIKLLRENALNRETYVKIARELSINEAEFTKCIDSSETKAIVEKDVELASSLGISGTPTWIIGENIIPGAVPYDSLKNVVDDTLKQFNGTNVDITNNEKVKGIILYAKDCEECQNDMLIPSIKQGFSFAEFEVYEINDAKAKEIIKQLKLEFVPVILVSTKVENSFFWKSNKDQMSMYFEKIGEWYRFKFENTGLEVYYLDEKKRIQLEEEKKALFNLDPNKPQIDFFIMSFCPYGNQAEEAIAEAYLALKDYAKFIPHYIYYPQPSGTNDRCLLDSEKNIYYCALHGIKELEQDVRELCVYNIYKEEKYFEFVKTINKDCSISNIDSCWKTVADKLKLDTSKIENCYNENKLNYVRAQVEKTEKLQVSGSPTVFVNGKKYNGARTPEAYKQALCNEMKDKPSACNIQLSGTQQQVTGSCG
ncbi:MAG: thioredoxin domain-containing protein [Candidatus Woesearchaeota archaeon]